MKGGRLPPQHVESHESSAGCGRTDRRNVPTPAFKWSRPSDVVFVSRPFTMNDDLLGASPPTGSETSLFERQRGPPLVSTLNACIAPIETPATPAIESAPVATAGFTWTSGTRRLISVKGSTPYAIFGSAR